MHLKRIMLGGFPIGLVVALLVSQGSFTVPHSPVKAPQSVSAGFDWESTQNGAAVAQIAADEAQARQDAIDALNAQQAQALADQLQAAADRLKAAAPQQSAPVQQASPAPTSGDCFGVNPYAAYIYTHESGCRLDAVNGGGCAGIGQACPGSKMGCSLSDAPCQLAYFEGYALGRYGSWEAAYQFWLGHNWW